MTCFVWVWLICIVCNHLVYPVAHLVGFYQMETCAASQFTKLSLCRTCCVFHFHVELCAN